MGFHLVERVYSCVTGTSPTAQAVLAYLAHRADDRGERKCYPDGALIESATHFGHTAVWNALNELREAKLLKWKSGGRRKGNGGRALANEYTFNLPVDKSGKSQPSSIRQADTINKGQIKVQPSVNGETEAVTVDVKKIVEGVADAWVDKKEQALEKLEIKRQIQKGVIDEAMDAAGVADFKNKQMFSSTIMCRDKDECLSLILEFGGLRRAGQLEGVVNPAAVLNSRLAALPICNQ